MKKVLCLITSFVSALTLASCQSKEASSLVSLGTAYAVHKGALDPVDAQFAREASAILFIDHPLPDKPVALPPVTGSK